MTISVGFTSKDLLPPKGWQYDDSDSGGANLSVRFPNSLALGKYSGTMFTMLVTHGDQDAVFLLLETPGRFSPGVGNECELHFLFDGAIEVTLKAFPVRDAQAVVVVASAHLISLLQVVEEITISGDLDDGVHFDLAFDLQESLRWREDMKSNEKMPDWEVGSSGEALEPDRVHPTAKVVRVHCPCGEEYAEQNAKYLSHPTPVNAREQWVWDRGGAIGVSFGERTCAVCGEITKILEMPAAIFHQLTKDSRDKIEFVSICEQVRPDSGNAVKGRKSNVQRSPAKIGANAKVARKSASEYLKASPEMAAVVGVGPFTRAEALDIFWAYIKVHHLQDKNNSRLIHADEKLRPIFGRDSALLFEIAEMMGEHLS